MSIDHASALEVAASDPGTPSAEWGGDVRGSEFLTSTDRTARCRELADDGYLVARVVPMFDRTSSKESDGPRSSVKPTELRNALEGAVEISLALRGALPPSVDIGAPVHESVRDQIYRLRKLGAPGLCIVLPELRPIANPQQQLTADDSVALEAWRKLSDEHPVVLLFDDADQDITMLAPRRLDEVFPMPEPTPTSWPNDARSLLEQTPTDKVEVATAADAELEEGWHEPTPAPSEVAGFAEDSVPDSLYNAPTRPGKRHERLMASDPLAGLDLDESRASISEPVQRSLFAAAAASSHVPSRRTRSSYGSVPSQGSVRHRGRGSIFAARQRLAPAEIARFCTELEEAQGPRPVSTIQQLFATHYTPLLEALSAGLDDPHV
jgi:hypothetical protein